MTEWISIEDGLPELVNSRMPGVWIYCPFFGPDYLYGYYSPDRDTWFNAWNDEPIVNVTHWMLRPDPPEVTDA